MNKILNNVVRLAGVAAILGLGSGCSTFDNDEYGCKGLPEGVSCVSSRDIYRLTEKPGPVRADPLSINEDGGAADRQAKANLIERNKEAGGVIAPIADTARYSNGLPLAASPINKDAVPIREESKIMRIWVAPWESTNGDLNVSGLVFTELEARRWTIGHKAQPRQPQFTPLQTISVSESDGE